MTRGKQPYEGTLPYETGYDNGVACTVNIVLDWITYIDTIEEFTKDEVLQFLHDRLHSVTVDEIKTFDEEWHK